MGPRRTSVRLLVRGLVLLGSLSAFAALPSPRLVVAAPSEFSSDHRAPDYRNARSMAHDWLDRLDVDPVDLDARDAKGKKKLAEALEIYALLKRFPESHATARVEARIASLAAQAMRPEYHDMRTCSDEVFKQNSMSYLRVLWLMRGLGLPSAAYDAQIARVKDRLDFHMRSRGGWQRAVFRRYYEGLGLELPQSLRTADSYRGLVSGRVPIGKIDRNGGYQLTHEVFAAFDYGLSAPAQPFDDEDHAYLQTVLPQLLRSRLVVHDIDLAAEVISNMTYLGLQYDPAYAAGVDYLLDHQNSDGSWGRYDHLRPRYGESVNQRFYLHTTGAALRALVEAYEMPVSPKAKP